MAQIIPPHTELALRQELTTREALVYSGLSSSYLTRLVRNGRIQARVSHLGYIIERGSLDSYLKGNRKRGRPPRKISR